MKRVIIAIVLLSAIAILVISNTKKQDFASIQVLDVEVRGARVIIELRNNSGRALCIKNVLPHCSCLEFSESGEINNVETSSEFKIVGRIRHEPDMPFISVSLFEVDENRLTFSFPSANLTN